MREGPHINKVQNSVKSCEKEEGRVWIEDAMRGFVYCFCGFVDNSKVEVRVQD